MNSIALWNIDDRLSIWGANVLWQTTLVTALVLSLALCLRRNPALRYGLLCSGLVFALLSPVLAVVMQGAGVGLLSVTMLGAPHPDPVATPDEISLINPLPTNVARQSREIPEGETQPIPDKADSSIVFPDQTVAQSPQSRSPQAQSSVPPAPTATGAPKNAFASITAGSVIRFWMPPLLVVWAMGALFCLGRLTIGWVRLAAILRAATPNTNRGLAAAFELAGESLRRQHVDLATLRRTARPRASNRRDAHISGVFGELMVSKDVSGPCVAGLWRPRVLFPASFVDCVSPQEARDILLHEAAHVVRRDQIIAQLQNLMDALYWLHPLCRILNRQLAQAREEICDNYVLTATDAPAYSRTLLMLTQLIQAHPPLPGVVGFFAPRWRLENRVADLLDQRRNRTVRLSSAGRILIVSFLFATVTLASLATLTLAEAPSQAQPAPAQTAPVAAQATPAPIQPASEPLSIALASEKSDAAQEPAATRNRKRFAGTVADAEGKPIAGASVYIVAMDTTNWEGVTLAEGVADASGRYELSVEGISSQTHRYPNVIARFEGLALAWNRVDLDRASSEINLALKPEQLIQIRLIDLQGRPAAQVAVGLRAFIAAKPAGKEASGVGLQALKAGSKFTSDAEGNLTIRGVPAEHGVILEVAGTDHFATQSLALNTGMPEQRPEADATYRSFVKNVPAGEVALIPLAPAQIFEGVVLLGDTDQPAAHAKISMWASQQSIGGSMISVEGKTDEQGRFRLNPYAGIRFGINAYPPEGSAYQVRSLNDLKWDSGERSKNIEIRLPLGVLAEGTVLDAESGTPLVGASVQYHPSESSRNRAPNVITGWQNIQKTDEQGHFRIPVLPGPGMLLVHAPTGTNYILAEKGERELDRGQPGGKRHYAHAFQKIDPPNPEAEPSGAATNKPESLIIKLRPGGSVVAKLVDSSGQRIERAIFTSRLSVVAVNPFWRATGEEVTGGQVEIRGLERGQKYPVFFLDPERKLGATATISLDDPEPTIELLPCGSAKARFVDSTHNPVRRGLMLPLYMVATPGRTRASSDMLSQFTLAADEDFASNFNHETMQRDRVTNDEGVMNYSNLVPGATYRYVNWNPKAVVEKEFVSMPGEMRDLGDIVVKVDE